MSLNNAMCTNVQNKPTYISVRELANATGISHSKLIRLIGKGVIPAFRLPGGKKFWLKEEDAVNAIEQFKVIN
ncbi:excisionase family DNA-binding protein [Pasteurellaceae bacterium HPA106]|uniref:excisionase family DNA-binding protein n=1 Tax=Spirabiliibacterium pneumoniae TaxID=221400 RepID=UPI001AACEC43|nr:excisionase family DNA-binding protein [Spirabiliibacterium pneumoniae]MBE2895596.1 excisionase family DNA-binding protein [Spirabiliibacterium pneumoniae]